MFASLILRFSVLECRMHHAHLCCLGSLTVGNVAERPAVSKLFPALKDERAYKSNCAWIFGSRRSFRTLVSSTSTSSCVQPRNCVKSLRVNPSRPSSIWTRFQEPIVFWPDVSHIGFIGLQLVNSGRAHTKCLSFAHGPIGRRNFSCCTPSNPASLIHPSNLGPGQGSRPKPRAASSKIVIHFEMCCSSFRDPSSE